MGTSTFLSLNIGLSALQAAQMGVNVTGNNIANAQTPGYARETVNQSEAPDLTTYTTQETSLGTGAISSNPKRIADAFVDGQNRYNTSKQSYWSQMNTELSNLQQVYNEPSGGAVSSAITSFFSAWNQLSQTPSDTGARAAVVQSAQNLVDAFDQVRNALQNNADRYQAEANTALTQVNTLSKNIADLNNQIQQAQQAGESPNALLDQRSALLDQLSKYVQINVTTKGDTENVTAVTASGSGIALVSGTTPTNLATTDIANLAPQSGSLTAYNDLYQQVTGNTVASGGPSSTGSGSAAGSSGSGTGLIPELNQLEQTIVGAVNNLQATGSSSSAMFTTTQPIRVVQGFTGSDINAGSGPTDGSNALQISNLLTNNGYLQTYSGQLTALGAAGSSAQSNNTTFTALQTQSQNVKTSVSGVDINQEMANLVQYQQVYSAASKYISIFNQMLTTLIQNT